MTAAIAASGGLHTERVTMSLLTPLFNCRQIGASGWWRAGTIPSRHHDYATVALTCCNFSVPQVYSTNNGELLGAVGSSGDLSDKVRRALTETIRVRVRVRVTVRHVSTSSPYPIRVRVRVRVRHVSTLSHMTLCRTKPAASPASRPRGSHAKCQPNCSASAPANPGRTACVPDGILHSFRYHLEPAWMMLITTSRKTASSSTAFAALSLLQMAIPSPMAFLASSRDGGAFPMGSESASRVDKT